MLIGSVRRIPYKLHDELTIDRIQNLMLLKETRLQHNSHFHFFSFDFGEGGGGWSWRYSLLEDLQQRQIHKKLAFAQNYIQFRHGQREATASPTKPCQFYINITKARPHQQYMVFWFINDYNYRKSQTTTFNLNQP